MVTLDLAGQTVQVNQSKIGKNPDPWHDVVIPGVDGRDDYCTVPQQPEITVRRRLRGKQPMPAPVPPVRDRPDRDVIGPSPEYSPATPSPREREVSATPAIPDRGEIEYITSLRSFAVSEGVLSNLLVTWRQLVSRNW